MQDERRRYFRITDQMGVNYYPLSEPRRDDKGEQPPDLGEQIVRCDQTIARLLEELGDTDAPWVELFKTLSIKLDCIASQIQGVSGLEAANYPVCSVNISACGLGLHLDQPLPVGSGVALDLLLFPERRRLQILAQVVACDSGKDEQHYVRFEFVDFRTEDQEELIQHIVRRQSDLLRKAREASVPRHSFHNL